MNDGMGSTRALACCLWRPRRRLLPHRGVGRIFATALLGEVTVENIDLAEAGEIGIFDFGF